MSLPPGPTGHPQGLPRALRALLLAVGVVSLAGAVAVFVVGPPADIRGMSKKATQPPPPPEESPPTTPPEPTTSTEKKSGGLELPDVFPPTAGDFHLESVDKEDVSAGILSYHTARYVSPEGTALSVRLVGLEPGTSAAFAKKAMEELRRSPAAQTVSLPDDWRNAKGESTGLFARDGAGLFVFGGRDRLVMVAAPDPEIALRVGRSLLGR